MAIIADRCDYRNAYNKHFHAFSNWGATGSDTSRRLLLIYSVECGLKFMLMESMRIYRGSEAREDIEKLLYSHNIHRLLKELKLAGQYSFPLIHTVHGDCVGPDTYHQMCRYAIQPEERDKALVLHYDDQLEQILNWLKERVMT